MKLHKQPSDLSEQELTSIIVHEMYQTYFAYGPGIYERVYEASLAGRLIKRGFSVERQRQIYISDEFVSNEPAFFADLIVEGRVIIELKSVEKLSAVAFTQLRSYLRLTCIRTGILVNFNCEYLKKNIHRISNGYHYRKAS